MGISSLVLTLILLPAVHAFLSPVLFTMESKLAKLPLIARKGSVESKSWTMQAADGFDRRMACSIFGFSALSLVSNAAFAQSREIPGRWAFRERGTPFEAGFGQDFTELPSGVRFKDISVGGGAEISDDTGVKMSYAGYVLENGKKFESSWDKDRVVAFKVGSGAVIKGLEEGIRGMHFGGRRIIIVPSELAYKNKRVYGGAIPAGATLVMYIEPVEEGFSFGILENPNAWKVGSLPEDNTAKALEKAFQCYNPKGCY